MSEDTATVPQPQFEYDLKVIQVDENLMVHLNEFMKDGWQFVPGIKPVGLYHMYKPKPVETDTGGGGLGRMRIDDSKVFIKRADGKIEKI